jgi:Ca2+-binding RTX toxin-like protein
MQVFNKRPRSVAIMAIVGALAPASVLAALIVGTSAPDFLEGTPDADILDGKGGADQMMGLGGDDIYFINQADDVVIEGAAEGTDTIKSSVTYTLPIHVENLLLTGIAAINGTGNSLNNRLTGNAANNILNGGGGSDTMVGKAGNDQYYVNASGDVVSEAADQGTDTVRSSVTHTLRLNVERLILTGIAAINGTGNALNNFISGNAASNVLNGGAGRDTLKGGLGQDAFQFDAPLNASTNVDRITDFNPLDDVIRLEGAVFRTLTTAGTLQASAFRAAPAAGDLSDRILYDPATGALRYDADGTGATAPVRFGTLAVGLAVTNANFEVHNPVAAPVVYKTQIQPIFTGHCVDCHAGASAPHGLKLDALNSYAKLVNVTSSEVPSLKRVEPGDPDNSYLVRKIEGTAAVGGRMPLNTDYGVYRPPLSDAQISLIRQWIIAGAAR